MFKLKFMTRQVGQFQLYKKKFDAMTPAQQRIIKLRSDHVIKPRPQNMTSLIDLAKENQFKPSLPEHQQSELERDEAQTAKDVTALLLTHSLS
jgi:hypothetical protein